MYNWKVKYTDAEIISAIKEGSDRKVLDYLYAYCLPKIRGYIVRNNGSEEEADDMFQDAVVVLYKQVTTGKHDRIEKINYYLFGIVRNLWINRVKKMNRHTPLENTHYRLSGDHNPLSDLLADEKEKTLKDVFSKIGEKCIELLNYSIYQKLSMVEIAEKMGFASPDAAKTHNYRCKKKLSELVHKNAVTVSVLKN